ncbi:Hemogen [Manis pentadactyla]|nr:Hemogen [Manis pentadactyla]
MQKSMTWSWSCKEIEKKKKSSLHKQETGQWPHDSLNLVNDQLISERFDRIEKLLVSDIDLLLNKPMGAIEIMWLVDELHMLLHLTTDSQLGSMYSMQIPQAAL